MIDLVQNQEEFNHYIKAIHAGHCGDDKPMTAIFLQMLEKV